MGASKKPYILGIDPGINGAIAVIDPNMGQSGLVNVWNIPTVARGIKDRRVIDVPMLAIQLSEIITDIEVAIIEDVQAMPRDGVVGAFSFGKTTGILWGMVGALMVPIVPVKPQAWKLAMNLSSDKNESRALATKYFPFHSHLWTRKKDTDRAEAVLLAEFGKRFY